MISGGAILLRTAKEKNNSITTSIAIFDFVVLLSGASACHTLHCLDKMKTLNDTRLTLFLKARCGKRCY